MWPTPIGDGDCDGFTDTPADFDDNQAVNILRIVQLTPPVFNTSPPDPNYSTRKDLNGDGFINILDVVRLTPPMFNAGCIP